MKYTYDPMADAINILFKKGRVAKTKEVSRGVMLDFDKKGTPLYLEILDVSKRFTKDSLKEGKFYPMRYSKREAREFLLAK
mgnify:CR=1 FL=1